MSEVKVQRRQVERSVLKVDLLLASINTTRANDTGLPCRRLCVAGVLPESRSIDVVLAEHH